MLRKLARRPGINWLRSVKTVRRATNPHMLRTGARYGHKIGFVLAKPLLAFSLRAKSSNRRTSGLRQRLLQLAVGPRLRFRARPPRSPPAPADLIGNDRPAASAYPEGTDAVGPGLSFIRPGRTGLDSAGFARPGWAVKNQHIHLHSFRLITSKDDISLTAHGSKSSDRTQPELNPRASGLAFY